MAKFLNTSAINYHLEEVIRDAEDRLILISPYLKTNKRVRELLEDKNRLKIDVRIVYGKSELQPAEIEWLRGLEFVRTSYCENLHAKCFLSEKGAILASMNLYDFSQVNNNEMGVFVTRDDDSELYRDMMDEAQRLIRFSEEVKLSLERVDERSETKPSRATSSDAPTANAKVGKSTSSRIARRFGWDTDTFLDKMTQAGFLSANAGELEVTQQGRAKDVEKRQGKHGMYFLWPNDMEKPA